MIFDKRTASIQRLIADYVRSPSLRHLRNMRSIEKLSVEIVKTLDQESSVWSKWDGPRDEVLTAALECWIPTVDMLCFLNTLPGPKLTQTDLEQRMRHLIEDKYLADPEEDLRAGCLEIYEAEKAAGTEMPAIIGRISQYVVDAWPKLRDLRRAEEERRREEARLAQEQRLLSSADCPWTQIRGSSCVYCRKNGRTFRLTPSRDKFWDMHRVDSVDDMAEGTLVGRYRTRGDASKVVAKAAYEPEPRW